MRIGRSCRSNPVPTYCSIVGTAVRRRIQGFLVPVPTVPTILRIIQPVDAQQGAMGRSLFFLFFHIEKGWNGWNSRVVTRRKPSLVPVPTFVV